MDALLFGTGGVPLSAATKTSLGGIQRIQELGLTCMELEFVQGVKMTETSAVDVGKIAKGKKIVLSAHAPYYINLNSGAPERIEASKKHILQTARVAAAAGAISIVFHPAFYMNMPPEAVYETVKKNLSDVMEVLKRERISLWVRPEVTGKASQFGSLEELIRLSNEVEGVLPCIDFAHLHARFGKTNTYYEFIGILEQVRKAFGRRAIENMHIHVSGISYTKQGERAHLDLRQSDFNYSDFIRALADKEVRGIVICESPNREDDALLLQETYRKMAS